MSYIQPMESKAVLTFTFTDYVFDNYINTDCKFPPTLWAEFSSSICRTTNACESYHSKLNSMFYHSHPNIYLFLEAVQEIQTGNYIKINTAHTQRKVRRAKASVEKEYSIAQEMKRFTNGEIDRLTYVKSLSRKFPPQNL
uniref:MULE domain-containing protein n=2 Tax=Cacopsylla melanoneura TaxID=428564 RepID=A0A8D8WJP9_9HEMI